MGIYTEDTYEKNKHKLVLTRHEMHAQRLGPSSGCTLGHRLAPLTSALLAHFFWGVFFCFIIIETAFSNQIDTSEPSSFYTFFVDTHRYNKRILLVYLLCKLIQQL